jgi:hypothetical protein
VTSSVLAQIQPCARRRWFSGLRISLGWQVIAESFLCIKARNRAKQERKHEAKKHLAAKLILVQLLIASF